MSTCSLFGENFGGQKNNNQSTLDCSERCWNTTENIFFRLTNNFLQLPKSYTIVQNILSLRFYSSANIIIYEIHSKILRKKLR